MKSYAVIIFFSIVSIVYFLVNFYVVSRGVKSLGDSPIVPYFKWTYWLLALSFLVGQILERGEPTLVGKIVTNIGSVWLALFLYILLYVIVMDIVRLTDYWFDYIPKPLFGWISNGVLAFMLGIILSVTITLTGWLNARFPRVHEMDISINHSIPKADGLKVALITDVHIGAMIGKTRVSELIDRINALHPDIVIFGGDLVDHNPLFVKAANIGPEFLRLKAPLGVYAVAGNHEFIGHAEVSIDYLQQFGVKYIRDTVITIDSWLQIAGRDDRERKQHEGISRKPIEDVMLGVNPQLPLLLIDHQPVEYDSAIKYNVDLMVSGHTHKGQLWPFGYITRLVFENDFGLKKRGNTWFYTSSGYGTWGPPVRTGNRPELVLFNIKSLKE